MLNKPRISVIMSAYNGERYLREAIDSILNQTFIDFEFLIVNDGSTDSSLKIIQSYDDQRIQVINNEKNIGATKSLNKAIREARGEYIARQDADDVSLPSRFEEQIKYFEKHPEVALLGTSTYSIDKNGNTIGKRVALSKPTMKDLLKRNCFSHGSVMFNKGVISKLGDYNELIKYSQDYELWLRIAKYYEVRNLAQALCKLRAHDENIRLINWEESILYHLFVLRLARSDFDEEILAAVNDSGIRSLHSYLSKDERIHFYKEIAEMHVRNNDLKAAREEYKKILSLKPLDIRNSLNILCSYLGKDAMGRRSKTYWAFMNFLQYLNNLRSK